MVTSHFVYSVPLSWCPHFILTSIVCFSKWSKNHVKNSTSACVLNLIRFSQRLGKMLLARKDIIHSRLVMNLSTTAKTYLIGSAKLFPSHFSLYFRVQLPVLFPLHPHCPTGAYWQQPHSLSQTHPQKVLLHSCQHPEQGRGHSSHLCCWQEVLRPFWNKEKLWLKG